MTDPQPTQGTHPTADEPTGAGLGTGTDISAADLDVDGPDEHVATTDPESYDDDGTLGGNGGADRTGGGAG